MWQRATRCCAAASVLCLLPWGSALAQLQGSFSMEKQKYEVGEPVFVAFELKNIGEESVQFVRGDRYSTCGGYEIRVSSGPPLIHFIHSSCDRGITVSCVVAAQRLAPGEMRRERILVNFDHDLSKAATYEVHATWAVKYGPVTEGNSFPTGGQAFKAEANFQIQVTDGNPENLAPAFQQYIADLSAKEEERRREAARVIGSLAPPFLEDTIISMADSPATLPFALMGLRRLNTSRSRETLAGFIQSNLGYSYWKERAIKYLSEMGDKKYFPLLLAVAKNQQPNQARDYVLAAAELGGEDAFPYVVSLLESADPFSRANAIMALPRTGSRRAVPMLIEQLRNPNPDVGRLASSGLMELTHRTAAQDGRLVSDAVQSDYFKWMRWWSQNASSASIYGPNQCGEVEPLK